MHLDWLDLQKLNFFWQPCNDIFAVDLFPINNSLFYSVFICWFCLISEIHLPMCVYVNGNLKLH